jgi:hypothetical protein
MITEDPIQALLRKTAEFTGGAQPFEGGEHLWIGNEGAKLAAARRGVAALHPVQRRRAPEALTYGEIVALSGDFYESAEDLFDEKPAALPWLWADNDLGDLLDALKKEVGWINLPPGQRGTSYPDQSVALWWNAKSYAELALRNTSHFGWHNALTYVANHEAALRLAALAAVETDSARRSLLWRQALYTNGFADHFLTDGFAAGHVRTPAAEIRAWGAGRGMDDKRAGVLVKIIHDQDGHVAELHGQVDHAAATSGLRVTNARGDRFVTHCDGQLFLSGTQSAAVGQAVEAVAASVGELLEAYSDGSQPRGVFAATQRLPWPSSEEPALIEKFPAGVSAQRVSAIFESIRWYLRLPLVGADVRPEDIRSCFERLPECMASFRASVTRDVARRADLVARLPPSFVAGYQAIR